MNKALNICRSSEIATQQLKAMKSEENKTEDVRAIASRQGNQKGTSVEKRKHWTHHQTKGNVAKRILNQRAINATVVGENKGIHWKAAQHLGTNVNRARTNHFASVCKSSHKRPSKRLTELPDEEQETDNDTYKVEEVSSAQTRGKKLHTTLEFCDPDAGYKTKLDCKLDTGATCNVLTHRDLSVICQTAYQKHQSEASTIQWECHETIWET